MSDAHFQIDRLTCAYQRGIPVLNIHNLPIPRGKLIFVIGLSGIGKSTFIEALGLMNNIFDPDTENSVHFYPNQGDVQEMSGLWSEHNRTLSAFRNQYFSFIFQNTNLMENFSAGENMCVSQLISGKSLEVAKPIVLDIMERLNLPASAFDKKVTELSGGQRQRLAFVRAITANFEVLFGDEPTGNLDKDTGCRLMDVLKKTLQDSQRTGIIVSHDLELAVGFADQIIMLTPMQEQINGHIRGTIEPETCMYQSNGVWRDAGGNALANPVQHIANTLGIQSYLPYA